MNIAYLFSLNESSSGVYKKIDSQRAMWQADGHNVRMFQVTGVKHTPAEIADWNIFEYNPSLYSPISRLDAWDSAVKSILAWNPDIVYYRYDLYYPALKRLFGNSPVVVEVNTDDLKEYYSDCRLRGMYNSLTRRLIFSRVCGIVFVTNELAWLPHFHKYNKKYAVIGNGINLDHYQPLPPVDNRYPRLVFLGTPGQPWHGVDKIIRLAQEQPLWRFDLIGISLEDLTTQPPENIICHGCKNRTEYEKILANADVAIGTLALHRKKMDEATPLKVREYLAYGLPVIIGYKDTDIPDDSSYILRLPNYENNVEDNIYSIKTFVEQWMGKRVPRSEALKLDLREKEKQKLRFMHEAIQH